MILNQRKSLGFGEKDQSAASVRIAILWPLYQRSAGQMTIAALDSGNYKGLNSSIPIKAGFQNEYSIHNRFSRSTI
jgi:hypothetical protein